MEREEGKEELILNRICYANFEWKVEDVYHILLTPEETAHVYKKLCEMYTPEVYVDILTHKNHTWVEFNWEHLGEVQGELADEFLVDIPQLKGDITHILAEYHIEQNKPKIDLSFKDLYPHIHEQHNIDPSNVLRIFGHGGDESESNNVLGPIDTHSEPS